MNVQVNEAESNKYHAGDQDASLNRGQNVNMVAEEVKYIAEMEEQPVKCRQVSFHCPELNCPDGDPALCSEEDEIQLKKIRRRSTSA